MTLEVLIRERGSSWLQVMKCLVLLQQGAHYHTIILENKLIG